MDRADALALGVSTALAAAGLAALASTASVRVRLDPLVAATYAYTVAATLLAAGVVRPPRWPKAAEDAAVLLYVPAALLHYWVGYRYNEALKLAEPLATFMASALAGALAPLITTGAATLAYAWWRNRAKRGARPGARGRRLPRRLPRLPLHRRLLR